MKKASQYFSEEEKKEIADAVLKAESLTSAEIVPVAATCSGRNDRAEDIIGVFFGIIAMIVVWGSAPHSDAETAGSLGQCTRCLNFWPYRSSEDLSLGLL